MRVLCLPRAARRAPYAPADAAPLSLALAHPPPGTQNSKSSTTSEVQWMCVCSVSFGIVSVASSLCRRRAARPKPAAAQRHPPTPSNNHNTRTHTHTHQNPNQRRAGRRAATRRRQVLRRDGAAGAVRALYRRVGRRRPARLLGLEGPRRPQARAPPGWWLVY